MNQQEVFNLVQSLKDPDWTVRVKAAASLGEMGLNTVELYLNDIASSNPAKSAAAAEALAGIEHIEPVKSMLEALSDNDVYVKKVVTEIFTRLGEKTIGSLVSLLENEEHDNLTDVSAALLGAITLVTKPLSAGLKDPNSAIRIKTAETVEFVDRIPQLKSLIEAAEKETESLAGTVALEVLAEAENQLVPSLVEALKDKEDIVRGCAAHALGWMKCTEAVEPLLEVLDDRDGCVRIHTIFALALIGDRRTVKPLLTALTDRNKCIRDSAAYALGLLKDRAAVPHLIRALGDECESVRSTAAMSLGDLGDRRAAAALSEALSDENHFVRMRAATALGEIRDEGVINKLVLALKDDFKYVRSAAVEALGTILKPGCEKRVIDSLIQLLKDPYPVVQWRAADILGHLGEQRALEPLKRCARATNRIVRDSALRAIEKIKAQLEHLVSGDLKQKQKMR